MTSWIDQPALWSIVAMAAFIAATFWTIRIENEYRVTYEKHPVPLRDHVFSITLALLLLAVHAWLSRKALVAAALVPTACLAASLRSLWRTDHLLLLIPDRLQLLGLGGGLCHITILAASGESPHVLAAETGFALAMVLLLWLLGLAYFKIRGTVGLGLGDVKLLGWLALFVGKRMPDLILIAMGLGILYLGLCTVRASFRAKSVQLPAAQDAFAFGPAIVLAAVVEDILHFS